MPTVDIRARHETVMRRLLPSAGDEALHSLVTAATHRLVRRRESIAEPGDASHVFVLLDGFAALEQDGPDGRRAMIAVIGAPQLVGLSRIRGGPSPNRILALTPCALLAWPRAEMERLAASDLGAANDLIDLFSATLLYIFDRLEVFAFMRAEARMAVVLLEHEDLWFGQHDWRRPPLERRDLAALAMVSREMAGRVVRAWEQAGVLRRQGPHGLELRDRSALEREAEGARLWRPREAVIRVATQVSGARAR